MLVNVCQDSGFILRIVVKLVKILHILIPILLIVLIIFDLMKVMTGAADDKAKKDAFEKAVKRVIYAVIVFLVPAIITFVFKRIEPVTPSDSQMTATSWISCWNYYYTQ